MVIGYYIVYMFVYVFGRVGSIVLVLDSITNPSKTFCSVLKKRLTSIGFITKILKALNDMM